MEVGHPSSLSNSWRLRILPRSVRKIQNLPTKQSHLVIKILHEYIQGKKLRGTRGRNYFEINKLIKTNVIQVNSFHFNHYRTDTISSYYGRRGWDTYEYLTILDDDRPVTDDSDHSPLWITFLFPVRSADEVRRPKKEFFNYMKSDLTIE